jgi:hypothetical protein
VDEPVFDGAAGGQYGLCEHLAAEHPRRANVAARTTEQVGFQLLQPDEPQELG